MNFVMFSVLRNLLSGYENIYCFVLAFLPFLGIINTHPKLPCACVHAAANHEAVTWFKDMQRARHGGVSHGTHKDRHILRQTVQKKRRTK